MPIEKNLQQLFEDYVNQSRYMARLSPETIRGYTAVFELFLSLMPEVTKVELLTVEMLTEFFKRLQTRERLVGRDTIKVGVKNSTIRTYMSKLHSFFEWLALKGITQDNPLRHIKQPELSYDDQRALSETDVRKLYTATHVHAYSQLVLRRDITMISLLVFCGLRLGEFISLEVRDIDFEKQLLTVRGQTSKSKRTRHIPIHPTLALHLRDYIAERKRKRYTTHFLIVSVIGDRELSKEGLKHWVKQLRRKSGVRFHLHQLRHTFACNLAQNNVNAVKIQRLLGHSSLNMTMTYLRSLNTEDMQEDIARLSI